MVDSRAGPLSSRAREQAATTWCRRDAEPTHRIEGPRGQVYLGPLSPRVCLIEIRGGIDSDQGCRTGDAVAEIVSRSSGTHVFARLVDLTHYHTDLRVRCTEALFENRARVRSVHCVATSKVVKMGIAVASLVLGGLVKSYDDLRAFEAALDGALAER
jgi:hypothetical protein